MVANGGEEAITPVPARQALHGLCYGHSRGGGHGFHYVLVLLAFERTGGVNESAIGRQQFQGVAENRFLLAAQIENIVVVQTPFYLGIAGQCAGTEPLAAGENKMRREASEAGDPTRSERACECVSAPNVLKNTYNSETNAATLRFTGEISDKTRLPEFLHYYTAESLDYSTLLSLD